MPEVTITNAPIKQYRFEWKRRNSFQLHINGEHFYPAMVQAIENSKSFVLLEMYLFKSGRIANIFISALCAATKRNVAVALMLDDFGALELNKADRKRLIDAGIYIAYYNPLSYKKFARNLFRDHRKILVVDGHSAFVGGAGITDEFDAVSHPQLFWRDTMLEIRGANVIDWQKLFLHTWKRWGDVQLMAADSINSPSMLHHEGNQLGRVMVTRAPFRTEAKRALVKRIRKAKRRVWLTTAYFAPSWKLRRALRLAARKNVDVRILIPGPYTDHAWVRQLSYSEYGKMLRDKVRIFEYQPRFLHTKVYICDDWVIIGSSNMDRWNLRWNLEADQAVDDAKFATEVTNMINTDLKDSIEVSTVQWFNRPLKQRLREWFWNKVARSYEFLSRIFNG